MLSKADTYRDDAENAAEEAKKAHSDDDGAIQRKRQSALNHLADNEDWLDGRVAPKPRKLDEERSKERCCPDCRE